VIPYNGYETNGFLDCKDKMIKYYTIHADSVRLNISLKILPQLPPKFLSYFSSKLVSAQFLSSTLCTKPSRLLHALDLFLKHYLVFNLPLPEGQAGTTLEPPEPQIFIFLCNKCRVSHDLPITPIYSHLIIQSFLCVWND